jgi:hypothetical protein
VHDGAAHCVPFGECCGSHKAEERKVAAADPCAGHVHDRMECQAAPQDNASGTLRAKDIAACGKDSPRENLQDERIAQQVAGEGEPRRAHAWRLEESRWMIHPAEQRRAEQQQ